MSILFITISCESNKITAPTVLTAHELWQSKKISSYTIDQKKFCYCPDANTPVRITVKADTIFSIIEIADNQLLDKNYFLSINSMFEMIAAEEYDSIVVRYNKEFGYPEFLDIDPQLRPVDGGVLYETSNLQIN